MIQKYLNFKNGKFQKIKMKYKYQKKNLKRMKMKIKKEYNL